MLGTYFITLYVTFTIHGKTIDQFNRFGSTLLFYRLRVEYMERQLANLTGLVQKALTHTVPTPSPRERDTNVSVTGRYTFLCIKNSSSFYSMC